MQNQPNNQIRMQVTINFLNYPQHFNTKRNSLREWEREEERVLEIDFGPVTSSDVEVTDITSASFPLTHEPRRSKGVLRSTHKDADLPYEVTLRTNWKLMPLAVRVRMESTGCCLEVRR